MIWFTFRKYWRQILKVDNDELKIWLNIENKKVSKEVYKVVMFTGTDCKLYLTTILMQYNFQDLTKNRRISEEETLKKKEFLKMDWTLLNLVLWDCSPYEVGRKSFVKSLITDKRKKSTNL